MFIIGWFIVLILKANDVVVPTLVSTVVGSLAIIELTFWAVYAIVLIGALVLGLIDKARDK